MTALEQAGAVAAGLAGAAVAIVALVAARHVGRPHPHPRPVYAGFDSTLAYPLVHRDCEGHCGLPHQPHEDRGHGTFVCHNCGHGDGSDDDLDAG